MDFTDDPFRDYRYEDPFNIAFDDEPADVKATSAGSVDAFGLTVTDKFDPFGLEGRQSVPLPRSSPRATAGSGRASAPLSKSELPSEDQQMAWAMQESLKLEEARKRKEQKELKFFQ